MHSMIEKVARAIYRMEYPTSDFDRVDKPYSDRAKRFARAAIEAMRDNELAPMIINNHFGNEALHPYGKIIYDNLIDAALKE